MLAWFAYGIISVVWGSTFLAIAYAVECFTPFGLSAVRFLPAGCLALLIGRMRKERPPSLREIPHLMVVGTLLLTICMALIGWAEHRVSSGVTAVLSASVPLFLGIMEPRGLGVKGWMGLGMGFLGVLWLLWPSGGGPDPAGAAVLILSACLWSFGTLYGRRHAVRAGHFSQVGVEMLVAGGLSLGLAPVSGGFMRGPATSASLAALAYLILFGSILAYSAYIHLAKIWPPARTGTYAYWNPVVGILLGGWLRGETLHAGMMPALLLILSGIGLVQAPGALFRRTRPGLEPSE
ncbi:MAG TPA: EamA family transporter [Holophaga sp.]|nr:EamA family transporter [Holophaga sp.]HPS66895.1 EamA family transporter [Holophaga sp.]